MSQLSTEEKSNRSEGETEEDEEENRNYPIKTEPVEQEEFDDDFVPPSEFDYPDAAAVVKVKLEDDDDDWVPSKRKSRSGQHPKDKRRSKSKRKKASEMSQDELEENRTRWRLERQRQREIERANMVKRRSPRKKASEMTPEELEANREKWRLERYRQRQMERENIAKRRRPRKKASEMTPEELEANREKWRLERHKQRQAMDIMEKEELAEKRRRARKRASEMSQDELEANRERWRLEKMRQREAQSEDAAERRRARERERKRLQRQREREIEGRIYTAPRKKASEMTPEELAEKREQWRKEKQAQRKYERIIASSVGEATLKLDPETVEEILLKRQKRNEEEVMLRIELRKQKYKEMTEEQKRERRMANYMRYVARMARMTPEEREEKRKIARQRRDMRFAEMSEEERQDRLRRIKESNTRYLIKKRQGLSIRPKSSSVNLNKPTERRLAVKRLVEEGKTLEEIPYLLETQEQMKERVTRERLALKKVRLRKNLTTLNTPEEEIERQLKILEANFEPYPEGFVYTPLPVSAKDLVLVDEPKKGELLKKVKAVTQSFAKHRSLQIRRFLQMTRKGSKAQASSVRPKRKPVVCEHCGKNFTSPWNLTTHLHHVHGIGNPAESQWSCHLCPKKFQYKGSLTYHLKKTHTIFEPMYCPRCGLSYVKEKELFDHVRYMHPESYFTCAYCSAVKFTKMGLHTHYSWQCRQITVDEKIMQQEKEMSIDRLNVQCHICHSVMKFRSLTGHLNASHPEHARPEHQCLKCNKSFRKLDICGLHMLEFHNILPEQWPESFCKLFKGDPVAVSLENKAKLEMKKKISEAIKRGLSKKSARSKSKPIVSNTPSATVSAATASSASHIDTGKADDDGGMDWDSVPFFPDSPPSYEEPRRESIPVSIATPSTSWQVGPSTSSGHGNVYHDLSAPRHYETETGIKYEPHLQNNANSEEGGTSDSDYESTPKIHPALQHTRRNPKEDGDRTKKVSSRVVKAKDAPKKRRTWKVNREELREAMKDARLKEEEDKKSGKAAEKGYKKFQHRLSVYTQRSKATILKKRRMAAKQYIEQGRTLEELPELLDPEDKFRQRVYRWRLANQKSKLRIRLSAAGATEEDIQNQIEHLEKTYVPAKDVVYTPKPISPEDLEFIEEGLKQELLRQLEILNARKAAEAKAKEAKPKEEKSLRGEGNVMCEICGKKFYSRQVMNKHVYTIHGDGSRPENFFQCPHCPKSYNTTSNLGFHMRKKHPDEIGASDVTCPRCFQRFNLEKDLIDHLKEKHPESYWPCKYCISFKCTRLGLMTHYAIQCKKITPEEKKKEIENEMTIEKMHLQCDMCDLPIRVDCFSVHLGLAHHCEREFNCGTCPQSFKKIALCMMHALEVHYIEPDEFLETNKLHLRGTNRLMKKFSRSKKGRGRL